MTSDLIAVDTNILIYLHDKAAHKKRNIAIKLTALNPHVPSQVVSEYINTCRRLLKLSKEELLLQSASILALCLILPTSPKTLKYAAQLISRYQFQLFDSIIIAASIQGKCSILYSEDMQNGLLVDNVLKIIDSFTEEN